MIFYLIGINYKRAPLNLRESAVERRREIAGFLKVITKEASALFTCNRVEIYGVAEDSSAFFRAVISLKRRFPEIFKKAYLKQGDCALEYALRLACGLESQLIGEGEILEQLHSWIIQDNFSGQLKKIWSRALAAAEMIRIRSGLKTNNANIADRVFKDLRRNLALEKKEVVIVGTGKVAQIFAKNCPKDFNLIFAARKKHSRARQFARICGGQAILLKSLAEALLTADVLISATSNPHRILGKEFFIKITKKREKTLYVYDLALPRDIDQEVAKINGIFLKNLNHLASSFAQANQNSSIYINRAYSLIREAVKKFKEEENASAYQSRHAPEHACFKAG